MLSKLNSQNIYFGQEWHDITFVFLAHSTIAPEREPWGLSLGE